MVVLRCGVLLAGDKLFKISAPRRFRLEQDGHVAQDSGRGEGSAIGVGVDSCQDGRADLDGWLS